MKIFNVYLNQNKYEILTYESIDEIVNSIEWQDVLEDYFMIIDEQGNIYKWDESKDIEYGTVYGYSLKIVDYDIELSNLILRNHELNDYKFEFSFRK
jgi:hypothetical protein